MATGISRLGRQTLAILSAALAVAALKMPTTFWVGVMSMVTAYWLLSGLALGHAAHGRVRAAWWTFAAAASASLAFSFGPWSDAGRRSAWPDPWSWSSRSAGLQPVTRLLVGLMPVVRPQSRAEILMGDVTGPVTTRIEIQGAFDRIEGLDPIRDRAAQIAAMLPMPGATPAERTRRAVDLAGSSLRMSEYQAIGHMIAALLAGGLVALGVNLSAASGATLWGGAGLRPVGAG